MLTTTLDGLWVLQVLSGIESLATELGLRPVLPSVESRASALNHPIAEELKAAGAIDEAGQVDAVIVEWLTVLSRRDVALLFYVTMPAESGVVGVMLARFSQWWVVIERAEGIVRIGPAGTATAEDAANTVVRAQVERLLGTNPPASIRPATIDATDLVARVNSRESLRAFLTEQRLVTIYDTPEGRLLVEDAAQNGRKWMIVSPGSAGNITTAINGMLRRLPATTEWFSHRRIV